MEGLPQELPLGVYYGWGNVDDGEVYKMVLSVGWNLYYKNTKKSMVSTKTPKSPWLVEKKSSSLLLNNRVHDWYKNIKKSMVSTKHQKVHG